MTENLMVMPITLRIGSLKIPTFALIDCGVSGYAFIDENFVKVHNLHCERMASL